MFRKIVISVLTILVLSTGAIWVRSYSVSHGLSVHWSNGNRLAIWSGFGEFVIQYLRFREGFSFGAVESTSYDSTDIRNQRPMRGDRMASLSWRRSVPDMLPNGGYMQNTFLLVPYWMIFSAVSLTLAVAILRAWRRARRVQTGYCSKCGYNLTGLPESRCPECGTCFER